MRFLAGVLIVLCLIGTAHAIRVWRVRRAVRAVVLQAETVTYLAALARLQRQEENR